MNFGVVNKSTTVNRFVLDTLKRNNRHLAVVKRKQITRKRFAPIVSFVVY